MSLDQPRQYRVKHGITLSASEVELNDLVVTAIEARGVHSLLTELIGIRRSVDVEMFDIRIISNSKKFWIKGLFARGTDQVYSANSVNTVTFSRHRHKVCDTHIDRPSKEHDECQTPRRG